MPHGDYYKILAKILAKLPVYAKEGHELPLQKGAAVKKKKEKKKRNKKKEIKS